MSKKFAEIVAGPVLPLALTREELGLALKVSGRTICRLVAQGKLPAPFKVGRGSRWRAEDVVDFIQGQGRPALPQQRVV